MNNINISNKFDFKDLFVLDLANNHQGSLAHARKIIHGCADVVKNKGVRGAIKFQFRDLPSFVHVKHRSGSPNKNVQRFLSTQLTYGDFKILRDEVLSLGMLAICTPFDEESVRQIVEMKFDVIKIASCSARDWPLLEAVASTGMPIIASTGGLLQDEVDDLVSFFRHRACDFSLMHCVSIYPTPDEECNLGNIAEFKDRYPGTVVGWSTHESPKSLTQIGLASALGAEMFERHVGCEDGGVSLNAYSSTPQQIGEWIDAYKKAKTIIGRRKRGAPTDLERMALNDLRRGVYAQTAIEADSAVSNEKIYFSFPYIEGQLSSGEWSDGLLSNLTFQIDEPVMRRGVEIPENTEERILKKAVHKVKAMLSKARIELSHEFTTEYSHHYGIDKFNEVGVVLITVINRSYAKKILVQLPGQRHPLHFHKLKEESFHILSGELISELDGKSIVMRPGDLLTVPPGVWHSFRSETGCIFEEISTTAYKNDSVYKDPYINELTSSQRKTLVDHWGRFQISEQLKVK
jgi:sialic acid synthase SpsE/quercetin dioxygenase-like cupin family protein